MKILAKLLPVLILLAGAVLAFPAAAYDGKTVSPYVCRPDRTTQAADLSFTRWGITNITGSTQYFVCPLVRDFDGEYSRFSADAIVSFMYAAQDVLGWVACVLYETDRATGITRTWTNEGAFSASPWFWEAGFVYTGYEYSTSPTGFRGQLTLRCSITPRITFYSLRLSEPFW